MDFVTWKRLLWLSSAFLVGLAVGQYRFSIAYLPNGYYYVSDYENNAVVHLNGSLIFGTEKSKEGEVTSLYRDQDVLVGRTKNDYLFLIDMTKNEYRIVDRQSMTRKWVDGNPAIE